MNEQLLCVNTIGCTPNCTGLYNFIGLYHCTGHYPSLHPPPPRTGLTVVPSVPSLNRACTLVQACILYPSLYRPVPLLEHACTPYRPVSLSRPVPLRVQWYRPILLPVPFHRIVLLYSSCLYSKHGFITSSVVLGGHPS